MITHINEYKWFNELEDLAYNQSEKMVILFTREDQKESQELLKVLEQLSEEISIPIYQMEWDESEIIAEEFSVGYANSIPVTIIFDGKGFDSIIVYDSYIEVDTIVEAIKELEEDNNEIIS